MTSRIVMLKPLLKKAIPLLAMIPLLGSCSLFQPQTKVIEYDEEVKLHDGSMIWVHIKRHYGLVGGVPSGHDKSYMPGAVEISWDTGFEGVGRKSVFFKRQIWTIEKLNNEWYVYGATDIEVKDLFNNSKSCNSVGTLYFRGATCLIRLNSVGEFLPSSDDEIYKLDKVNVLYSTNIGETEFLDNRKISWQKKIDMQHGKAKDDKTINRKLFSQEGK